MCKAHGISVLKCQLLFLHSPSGWIKKAAVQALLLSCKFRSCYRKKKNPRKKKKKREFPSDKF